MDSGLHALVTLARYHQVPVDLEQIKHQFAPSGERFNEEAIQLGAKSLKLRCKLVKRNIEDLEKTVLPAIARTPSGDYFIVAKVKKTDSEHSVVVQVAGQSMPETWLAERLAAAWDGSLILLGKGDFTPLEKAREFNLSWFLPALKKYRRFFAEVLIASVFIQIFALLLPLFFQVVMDKVLVHRGFTTLDVLAIGFTAVVVFEALLGGARQYVLTHTTHRVDTELGAKLYRHLIALPQSWFESRQVGHSVARVRELDLLRQFITGSALTLTIDVAFTGIFIAVLFYYSSTLAWIVVATLPLYFLLSLFITPILRHRLNQQFQYGAHNQAFLVESISGIQTVKSMAVEPQMARRWEDQLAKSVTATFRASNVNNVAEQISSVVNKLATIAIIWVGAHLVIAGDLTVGQLVAFNMIAGRVSAPILKLVQLWQEFQQASISIKRLGDILNTPTEPQFDPNRSTLPTLQGDVVFDRVRFRYRPDGPVILDGISLHVTPGESIGIVGRSGSGKSTLTKLIQRLYVPEGGRVLVDGADLVDIDAAWLRRNVGVVLQENFLFNRTVRENIALANPGAEMSDIVAAAQLAGAHDFIMSLPKAYDTEVGEQGCTLSGGQRQRIAIARALLTCPKILIFDEATSALDYESERIIHDNMATISEGRTVFVIAHRLSAVRQCDRIVVMENGRIVQCGTHADLLAQEGVYAKLYHIQHSEEPKAGSAKIADVQQSQSRRPVVRTSGNLAVSHEQGCTVISALKKPLEAAIGSDCKVVE